MGGYIRWTGLVDDATQAITVTERLAGRQLDPFAREVIMVAADLRAGLTDRRHVERPMSAPNARLGSPA